METSSPSGAAAPVDTRHQRRLLPIIDAHFQWKYTLIVTIVGVGSTAVLSAFLYTAHMANTRLLDLAGDAQMQEQVAQGDKVFLLYLLIGALAQGVVLAIWGLIVTHRISGPVYMAARYLGVIVKGQYPDVRPLRKHDELQGFFKTLAEAVQAMRQRDREALTEKSGCWPVRAARLRVKILRCCGRR